RRFSAAAASSSSHVLNTWLTRSSLFHSYRSSMPTGVDGPHFGFRDVAVPRSSGSVGAMLPLASSAEMPFSLQLSHRTPEVIASIVGGSNDEPDVPHLPRGSCPAHDRCSVGPGKPELASTQ